MSSPIILQNPALSPGEMVLVTGVNGFMASHIADQLLLAGYAVRGTVRALQKNSWMNSFFSSRYPAGKFEMVEVADMSVDGCFDEAVKGCAAIIHTTSSVDLTATSPEPTIEKNVRTVLTALESATRTEGVKRFILTSSFWTASAPNPDTKFTVTPKNWNDQAITDAYSSDPSKSTAFSIFMAGKLKAEKACWEFIHTANPDFTFNAILPDTIFGSILSPKDQGTPSTAGLVKVLYSGQNLHYLNFVQPQWFIDVTDNAKLHVATLIHPNTQNERILGAASPWNWNDVLAILKTLFPERDFVDDLALGRDISVVENGTAAVLLSDVYGQGEWTTLEESIKANARAFGTG